MYSKFELARKYLHYFLTASNGKGHGVHSPFTFEFVTKVLNDKRHFYAYEAVESLREKLKLNKEKLLVDDFGAGSAISNPRERAVSDIARYAAKPAKWGKLLFRICNYYQPANIVELGTSLGLSTAYLAMANKNARCLTIEGSEAIAAVAKENFKSLRLANIKQVNGNFDDMLPGVLNSMGQVDLAFIDGNHSREPTINYFNQLLLKRSNRSIFIFDDIHWSAGMEEAWTTIKAHSEVLLSIDLFFLGIIFFRDEFRVKQHFTICF